MRLDEDTKLIWPRNRFTTCDFNQLFDGDWELDSVPEEAETRFNERLLVLDSDPIEDGFAEEHPDKKSDYHDIVGELESELEGLRPEDFEDQEQYEQEKERLEGKIRNNGKLRKKIEVNNGRNIDHEYERIPQSVKDSYIEQVRKLTPVKYIRDQIEEFSFVNFDEDTVSVHMRSWADDPRRQCLFSYEDYYKHMDKMEDKTFFVCADHQSCIDTLKQRYGNRVFDYPKRGDGDYSPGTDYMSTLEASQDAIIEMYLLGKNPIILGSYLSTFVEVGWWLNECKGKVTIV